MKRGLLAALALLLVHVHARQLRADDSAVAMHTLPVFEARLTSDEVDLGRPFELCLVGRHRRGTRVLWPERLELGDAFEQRARRVSSQKMTSAEIMMLYRGELGGESKAREGRIVAPTQPTSNAAIAVQCPRESVSTFAGVI
jgi:hypothetical protein